MPENFIFDCIVRTPNNMNHKISSFESTHSGERLFIVGNGPSLQQTPLSSIQNEYSMGMNKIHEIYAQTDWRPSFYINPWEPSYFSERNERCTKDIINVNKRQDIPCFIHHQVYQSYSGEQLYPLHNFRLQYPDIPFHQMDMNSIRNIEHEHLLEYWSDNLHHVVYEYHAMYVAIQLAVYMGFDCIYILGADLGRDYRSPHMIFDSGLDPYKSDSGIINYALTSVKKGVAIQSIVNALMMKSIQQDGMLSQLRSISDQLHFSHTYDDRLIIKDFQKDDKEIKKSHIAAKRICNDRGIDIYNATIGGNLDVYPRVNLTDVL